MPNVFVISIMAKDRVGIVADVATVIKNLHGNLGDLSQTVLRGYFTMILVADFPDEVAEDRLRDALRNVAGDDPFEVAMKRPECPLPAERRGDGEAKYVLTAVGPDQIGLVAAVAEYLRHKHINIEDLATRVEGDNYTMILLLNLPAGTDVRRLNRSLQIAMADTGVQVQLMHHSIFRATNEI